MAVYRNTRLETFIQERGLSIPEIQAAIPMHRSQLPVSLRN